MVNFATFLKQGVNIAMNTDALVNRVAHEGLNFFDSLLDFDEKSIKALQTACKEKVDAINADAALGIAAQAEIPGVSIPSKCILRLIEAVHCAHYYRSVGRSLNSDSLHYTNVLAAFKVERMAYEVIKDDAGDPKVPLVNDKDGDRKIMNWVITTTWGDYPYIYVYKEKTKTK